MTTRITTALVAGALLFSGLTAVAQTPPSGDKMMSNMTCQQMMDKAKPMVGQMSDQAKMSMAQKEMAMAKTDMDAGKMDSCKMHMNKVMGMTK